MTYDPHPLPTLLPFPSGFTHDLSLLPFPSGFTYDLSPITDENLPTLTNSPNTPSIVGWGSYKAVLDGGPVFMTRLNVTTGRWRQSAGQGVSIATQLAIAAGCDYSWTRRAVSQKTALLWRTAYDADCVMGYSGSVLCLGKPTDATAQAVVFQNFQAPLRSENVIHDYRDPLAGDHRSFVTGGFLLPEEIRQCTIEMEGSTTSRDPQSLNAANRISLDEHRRLGSRPEAG
jgi:hypothetical protein